MSNSPQSQSQSQSQSQPSSLPSQYNLPFIYICKLFEKLSTVKPKEKQKIFTNFLTHYFSTAITSHISLYPFFRLVFPKLDRLRSTYGIQETFLGNFYSQILSLPEQERLMLKHWKNPNFLPSPAPVGDFVNLVHYIISTRVTTTSTITINEVNEHLTCLAKASNRNERTIALTKIIKQCTAQEQKWILSIILKDIKIGFSSDTFFKLYDAHAINILNSTSSLVEVCEYISNANDEKYVNTFYKVFAPIKPMLVARMTLDKILTTFTGVNVYVETKFDGERIQCHLHNKNVKFFSRNGIDYTYLYAPKLSHLIVSCVNADSAILDGEIVVWDKKEQKYAPFGETKTVALAVDDGSNCGSNGDSCNSKTLVYEIFDIILLAPPRGEIISLNNVILKDRKTILNRLITPVPKKIEIITGKETNSVDEVMDEFMKALDRGEEGIVIKKTDSLYKPDERCSDWVKMKCDYIDTIVDTLDLVIIGGYYGEAKRFALGSAVTNTFPSFTQQYTTDIVDYSDSINSFLLGVVKTLNTSCPKNSKILPIVKVGSGFNSIELNTIRNQLKNKWKKYEPRAPPSYYGQWTPNINDRPDIYIDNPSESILLEIKAAEIIPTTTFPAKVTLRFPRLVKIKHDKTWCDALKHDELLQYYDTSLTTLNTNNALYEASASKAKSLQHKHILKRHKKQKHLLIDETTDNIDNSTTIAECTKKNKVVVVDKYSKILETFRDTDTSNITKQSNLFAGFQFMIVCLDEVVSNNIVKKKMMEYTIVENGGEKVQNYLPNRTTHVIAEKIDLKIRNIISQHDINVFNSKWVYDCVKLKRIIPVMPMYLTYVCSETKEMFAMNIDKYNDSYYEEVDTNVLREIFGGMMDVNVDNSSDSGDNIVDKAVLELRKEFNEEEMDVIMNDIYK